MKITFEVHLDDYLIPQSNQSAEDFRAWLDGAQTLLSMALGGCEVHCTGAPGYVPRAARARLPRGFAIKYEGRPS